jgi:hypothetical protein
MELAMNIGMLWFDNDSKAEISTKIERAAVYYRDKYGIDPNLCFVHPSMVQNGSLKTQDDKLKSGNVEIRTSRSVLPNHFWIGVNGTTTA